MLQDHLKKIEEQLAKGPTIGERKTPVVSFWPMRDKWKKYGDYWESWATDGVVSIPTKVVDGWRYAAGTMMAPAELKVIYFRIPSSDIICQLAYEHDPAEPETGRTALRRNSRTEEVFEQGKAAVKRAG